MMRSVFKLLTLSLLLVAASKLSAQVQIDVKTKWFEKKELTATKHGVIAAIEDLQWASCTEFGEDYALWLTNLHRTKGEDTSVIVTLDIEVRTPSLFGKGTAIEQRTITIEYDLGMLDSIGSIQDVAESAEGYRDQYEEWNRTIGSAIGSLLLKGQGLVGPIISGMIGKINAAPKSEEVFEAVLVGAEVAGTLEDIFNDMQ